MYFSVSQVILEKPGAHLYGLSYHSSHVYWSEFRRGRISRLNVDDVDRGLKPNVDVLREEGGGGRSRPKSECLSLGLHHCSYY